jgi:hypothetical protein
VPLTRPSAVFPSLAVSHSARRRPQRASNSK